MSSFKWDGWPIPQKTCLGTLELKHVFVFVDIPLFFICRNENKRFIATCIEESKTWFEFLYVELYETKYNMLIAGQVDFHDSFIFTEAKTYIVRAKHINNYDIIEITNKEIREDWLPISGDYYAI